MRGRTSKKGTARRVKEVALSSVEPEVVWSPQPKQELALTCPAYEVFFGGARGGGKSDFLLVDFLRGIEYGDKWNGILFRRTLTELEQLVARSRKIYGALGADFKETVKTWTFPSGATLKMRYLDNDSDVYHYHGHSYQWVGFDELCHWSTPTCYTFLHSCVRSADGVPCSIRATGNPGDPGHMWVKDRFIDPSPAGVIFKDERTGLTRCFIPSYLEDNLKLVANDPDYEQRLMSLPPHLYDAYRHGNWEIFEGQEFRKEWMQYWTVEPRGMNVYILVDPAGENKRTKSYEGSYTAMFVVAIGSDGNYYVCDIEFDKMGLKERTDKVFELHEKWGPLKVGYEKYGMQSDIAHIEGEQIRRNYRFTIVPLKGNIAKKDRIKQLIPDFQEAKMFFPHHCYKTNYEGLRQDLVAMFIDNELTAFPVKPRLGDYDLLDCLARIKDPDMNMIKPRKHNLHLVRNTTYDTTAVMM